MLSTAVTKFKEYFLGLQSQICNNLAAVDGTASFLENAWKRRGTAKLEGDDVSCVLAHGSVFEKAGVNFSHVTGESLHASAKSICSNRAMKNFTQTLL